MQRRTFIKTAGTLTAMAGITAVCRSAQAASRENRRREYYELRAYRLKEGAGAESLHQFLEKAALPALRKIKAGPVGVFTETEPKGSQTVFVLIPYPNLDAYLKGTQWLKEDPKAREIAPEYVEASKDKAAYERIDSWLLMAFAGMPRMEIPAFSKQKKEGRIFELRTYESYSEVKAAKKVDMFNDGEIDIMREVGLSPLFYGEALAGANLPHLSYMTCAESQDAHKAHWDAFVKHPKWDKMKNDPQYADTVSKITKWFLKPTAYSEI